MHRCNRLHTSLATLSPHPFTPALLTCGSQLTKIGAIQKIANHHDRRDKWLEGIATVAWSELPCEADLRGEAYTLSMELGSTAKERRAVRVPMQPGSAYVLMGAAQACHLPAICRPFDGLRWPSHLGGRADAHVLTRAAQGCTKACTRKCVGHSTCSCCWTHGVEMERGASVTRHSMTLRVLAEDSESSEEEDDEEDEEEG